MILERFPEIMNLPLRERLQLVRELTDSMYEQRGEADPDPTIVAEIQRRMDVFRADPKTGAPWADVRQRIFGK